MKCEICGKKTKEKLCGFHEIAYDNLRRNYTVWKHSKNISWKKYLTEVKKNPLTGIWVKEMIPFLLSSSDPNNLE